MLRVSCRAVAALETLCAEGSDAYELHVKHAAVHACCVAVSTALDSKE